MITLRPHLFIGLILTLLISRAPAQSVPPSVANPREILPLTKTAGEWPKIRREDVLARVAAESAGWQARLPASRPRLFFDAASWRALRPRFEASTGRERELFENTLSLAREIATEPVPRYRTPDELGRDGKATFDSRQELWMRPVGDGMVVLSFALALRDDPAIRAKLRETVLAACDYPHWGAGDFLNRDLACGHIARGIAIARDWHPSLWTEADLGLMRATLRERVGVEVQGAYGSVFWAAHYVANHNHVNNAAIGLCGLAFLDEIPEAAEWTALAKTNFEMVVRVSSPDGGSIEGVPYLSYAVSFIVQYIEGTRHVLGTAALYESQFLRNAISYRTHVATPDLGSILPWGDAPRRDYYGPQHFLYRLASQYRDPAGQYLAEKLPFSPVGGASERKVGRNGSDEVTRKAGADVQAFAALWFDPTVGEKVPTQLDHWFEDLDIATTRSAWGPGGYLLSVKSGYTNRNHSHLDAGALVWSAGAEWLVKAPGYGTVDARGDFWNSKGPRWTFFSNSTESHSTLLINGRNQRFTPEARGQIDSFLSSPGWCWLSVNLAEAYDGVKAIRRDVLHRRGDYALVLDDIEASSSAQVEWLAQLPTTATVADGRALVAGEVGAVELHPLLPTALKFARRAPVGPHLDLPPGRLDSYALRQDGEHVRFAVALLPGSSDGALRAKIVSARPTEGGQEFVISGAGWRDEITVRFQTGAGPRVTAVRRVGDRVDSVVLVATREVSGAGPAFALAQPADVALQAAPDGAWRVDAGNELRLTAPLDPGWQLRRPDGTEMAGMIFPAGRYLLLRAKPQQP